MRDVGGRGSCDALNAHLTALLKPGITRDARQRILNFMDAFTHADPAEWVHVRDWTTAGALAIGGVPPIAAGERAAGEAAAAEGTAAERATAEASAVEAREAPPEMWTHGWANRGREIHEMLGDGSLGPNFPVIDMISPSGVVTSIKSIDLRAAVYQNDLALAYRINDYLDKVSEFDAARLAKDIVSSDQIIGRVFAIGHPKRKPDRTTASGHRGRPRPRRGTKESSKNRDHGIVGYDFLCCIHVISEMALYTCPPLGSAGPSIQSSNRSLLCP